MHFISCMQTEDEKAMLKVSMSDIKHFLQWKGASVAKKVWLTNAYIVNKAIALLLFKCDRK